MQPRQEARGLALNVGEDPGVTDGGLSRVASLGAAWLSAHHVF